MTTPLFLLVGLVGQQVGGGGRDRAGGLCEQRHVRQAYRAGPAWPFLWLLLLWLAAASSGCGYHFAASSSATGGPGGLQRVSVPIFRNLTFEPLVEKKLTGFVQDEVRATGGFELVTEAAEADLLVQGSVTAVTRTPISFESSGRVGEYRVQVVADAQVVDVASQQILWEGQGLVSSAEYLVGRDPAAARAAQDRAVEEAAKRLAARLLVQLREARWQDLR